MLGGGALKNDPVGQNAWQFTFCVWYLLRQ